jgi:hypothetical protein
MQNQGTSFFDKIRRVFSLSHGIEAMILARGLKQQKRVFVLQASLGISQKLAFGREMGLYFVLRGQFPKPFTQRG